MNTEFNIEHLLNSKLVITHYHGTPDSQVEFMNSSNLNANEGKGKQIFAIMYQVPCLQTCRFDE